MNKVFNKFRKMDIISIKNNPNSSKNFQKNVRRIWQHAIKIFLLLRKLFPETTSESSRKKRFLCGLNFFDPLCTRYLTIWEIGDFRRGRVAPSQSGPGCLTKWRPGCSGGKIPKYAVLRGSES